MHKPNERIYSACSRFPLSFSLSFILSFVSSFLFCFLFFFLIFFISSGTSTRARQRQEETYSIVRTTLSSEVSGNRVKRFPLSLSLCGGFYGNNRTSSRFTCRGFDNLSLRLLRSLSLPRRPHSFRIRLRYTPSSAVSEYQTRCICPAAILTGQRLHNELCISFETFSLSLCCGSRR